MPSGPLTCEHPKPVFSSSGRMRMICYDCRPLPVREGRKPTKPPKPPKPAPLPPMAPCPKPPRCCAWCEQPSTGMHCSVKCKTADWRRRNPERFAAMMLRSNAVQRSKPKPPPEPRIFSRYFTSVCACGAGIGGKGPRIACDACTPGMRKARAFETWTAKKEQKHRDCGLVVTCADCAIQYCPLFRCKERELCPSCSQQRARVRRSAARSKRRAVLRAAVVETVNPIKVFERDQWTCKGCGCPTPRSLRGSIDPCAPELDHITPLSKGGAHSYNNTQCLCRRCNGIKADQLLPGQQASFI